jgi:hypothetical protein
VDHRARARSRRCPVDVSDSVSDKQLDAREEYVDELASPAATATSQSITFAEKPRSCVPPDTTLAPASSASAGDGARHRHPGRDAARYGLYPDGQLPRMVIVSDGNQTAGDLAVEAYRAKELNVKVSWRTFSRGQGERRCASSASPCPTTSRSASRSRSPPRCGRPSRSAWCSSLQQDEFANALEPRKDTELREGKNLIKFKSEAKRAGATTYTPPARQLRQGHREGPTTWP